jgi:uncharacterized protein (DUF2062 family)
MIAITRALIRKWMESLLHIHDTPQRTALAFAVGVFIGFSPFLGLHTIIAIAIAFLFNLNRVSVLVGAYSNMPWFLAAWYALATAAGAWLLGTNLPAGFGEQLGQLFGLSLFRAQFWRALAAEMRPLFWPYFVGSTIGSTLLSVIAYWLAFGFIEARHRHAQEARRKAKH